MSTLDEAFIKAYRKGQAAKQTYAPQPGSQATNPRAAEVPAHAAVPAPHAHFAPQFGTGDGDSCIRGGTAACRASAPRAAIRPVFEVRHFIWPQLIGSLIAHAQTDLQSGHGPIGGTQPAGPTITADYRLYTRGRSNHVAADAGPPGRPARPANRARRFGFPTSRTWPRHWGWRRKLAVKRFSSAALPLAEAADRIAARATHAAAAGASDGRPCGRRIATRLERRR